MKLKTPLIVPEHVSIAQGITVGHYVCGECMHRMQPSMDGMICPNPHCEQWVMVFPMPQNENTPRKAG